MSYRKHTPESRSVRGDGGKCSRCGELLAAMEALLPYLEERSQPGERWAALCAREAINNATKEKA